jgi:hypothetical protein
MWRISRDRYLTPDEVKEVGFKVCRKISGNFSYTYTCAIGFESENVGMFRGQPVLYRYEEGFYELSKMIMAKKNKRIMPELLVLMAITGIGDK